MNQLNGQAGVLFFPAGTYLLTQTIICHSGLILKGEGAEQTHIQFFIPGQNQNAIVVAANQSESLRDIVSGFYFGSNSLLVDNANGIQANDFIELQQSNGDWDVVPISWAENAVGQIVQIESVNGNELTLKHKLRYDYEGAMSPKWRKILPIIDVKLEDIKIERLDEPDDEGAKNIYLSYAINCQISGVESFKSQGSHLYITNSSNIYVFGNYFHDSFLYDGTATRGYGVTLNKHSGEVLVENNIFRNLRHAMMVKTGANGNVFSYNYSREPHRSEPISDYSGDISVHGHFAYANLFEENIVQNIIINHYWGPGGPFNTFFRNRTELYGLIMTTNSVLETQNQNFVGNEIDNSFPYGFYTLTGSGHFEYGNNDGGTAIPTGTNDLPDISYCYSERPWFLESSYSFPAIGYPNDLRQGTIPAKERYFSGGPYTVSYDATVGVAETNAETIWNVQLIGNPVRDVLKLKTS